MRLSSKQRGVGRPPAGEFAGKSTTLTTRLTPATKAALEREAKKNKRSLSQEVELRLVRSLELPSTVKQNLWGEPHNKALAALTAKVAFSVEFVTGCSWRDSRFTWEALAAGMGVMLDYLKPKGDTEIPVAISTRIKEGPEQLREHFRSWEQPAEVGLSCGLGIVDQLTLLREPPPLDHPADQHFADGFYQFPAIRRDLGL
jgi:hypothetical protein